MHVGEQNSGLDCHSNMISCFDCVVVLLVANKRLKTLENLEKLIRSRLAG